jgi:hypothetical protein
VANTGNGKTRAEVKAELVAAGRMALQYEVEHHYPNAQQGSWRGPFDAASAMPGCKHKPAG